jgi:hypothetical protein
MLGPRAWLALTKSRRYNKNYTSAAEENFRFQAFLTSLARIADMNAAEGDEVFGLSPFVDLTPEEFRAAYLMPKHVLADASPSAFARLAAPLSAPAPKAFDWRSVQGTVTPVKNQGQCGRWVMALGYSRWRPLTECVVAGPFPPLRTSRYGPHVVWMMMLMMLMMRTCTRLPNRCLI